MKKKVVQEKKLIVRILVLAIAAIMFLGFIIFPIISIL